METRSEWGFRFICRLGLVVGLAGQSAPVSAQAPQGAPTAFEAATVKLDNSTESTRTATSDPGRLRIGNQTLRTLLSLAYGVKEQQVIGPDWIGTQGYDIEATVGAPLTFNQMMPLLIPLLEARLQMRAHRENRTLEALALVVAKSGLKVQATDHERNERTGFNNGSVHLAGTLTVAELAEELSRTNTLPVVDRSGLTDRYTFDLKWTPPTVAPAAGNAAFPDLPIAIEEQAGLTLEARKEPMEVIVIDRIERTPSDH